MRHAQLALLAVGWVLSPLLCCVAPGPSDYAQQGLRGPVRQVIARHYQMRYDGTGERLRLGVVVITRFDGAGRLAEQKYFDEKDQLTSSATFTRDGNGRLAGRSTWSRGGKLEERVEYRYDRQGRLASETFISRDGRTTGSFGYEYDALGRLKRRVMESSYSNKENRTGYTLYEYDAGGRRLEERYYEQGAGGLASRSVFRYEGDHLVSSADYTYGTQLSCLVFYEHDPAGNLSREAVYWLPEDESSLAHVKPVQEKELPRSFLRSLVEYEFTYYEK